MPPFWSTGAQAPRSRPGETGGERSQVEWPCKKTMPMYEGTARKQPALLPPLGPRAEAVKATCQPRAAAAAAASPAHCGLSRCSWPNTTVGCWIQYASRKSEDVDQDEPLMPMNVRLRRALCRPRLWARGPGVGSGRLPPPQFGRCDLPTLAVRDRKSSPQPLFQRKGVCFACAVGGRRRRGAELLAGQVGAAATRPVGAPMLLRRARRRASGL